MRKKLFIYGFTASIIAVLLTGFISFFVTQSSSVEESKLSAQSMANIILNEIRSEDKTMYDQKAKSLGESLSVDENGAYRITIIDADGKVLGDSSADISSMDNHAKRPEVMQAQENGYGSSRRDSDTLDINMLYVAVKDAGSDIVVRIALPLTELQRMSYNLFIGCLISIAAGALVSLIASYMFARRLGKPIKRLAVFANNLAEGNMQERAVLKTNTELDELAYDFNEMAFRLSGSLNELKHKNVEFDTVLSSMENGLIAVDIDKKILYMNPVAKQIFNVTLETDGETALENIIYQKRLLDAVVKCLAQKSSVTLDLKIGGEEILDFRVTVSPMFYKHSLTGAIMLFADVTHILELEKLRSDFVANVSHELRTPLTSIKGYAEALKDDGLENKENAARFLDVIEIEADRLNVLINDLMELSKIENNQDDNNLTQYDFKDIVRETAELVRFGADKKGVDLILDIPDKLIVYANKDRIKQLLLNLMDNGIKYNKQGGKLFVSAAEADGMLRISVKDTGEGIAQEDIPRLFERFYRVDKSRSRELGGTGLGLSIVKHIAELYSGSVTVNSTKGEGAEFIVKIAILKNN